jgi:CPA2 family monovalent cation:H+ antiporter-2
MHPDNLATVLILLGAVIVVVALVRRLRLPPIVGYLLAGMVLGPYSLGLVADSGATSYLGEIGVVFLLFTLGLGFSLPRLMARRREVLGLGSLQVVATTLIAALFAHLAGFPPLVSVVLGGGVAMSSTAIVMQQLGEQAELNRAHGRLAFSILLFQDLVFVLFLGLAAALGAGGGVLPTDVTTSLSKAALGLLIVLAAGRFLARPLFYEITRSGSRELFTVAVLFVSLGSAYLTHLAGLSLALGGFLAGLLLAETEYRHQVDAVIRPFRDVLLGLFFVTIGTLLDIPQLVSDLGVVTLLLLAMLVVKTGVVAIAARAFCDDPFKALRAGLVVAVGGEFGFALITVLLQQHVAAPSRLQPLLAAIVLSMVASPLIIRHNKQIARVLMRQHGPDVTALAREAAVHEALAAREHVILCGYGRVGQNIARVLEQQGHEYIAVDLDPARVRTARQAGDPVLYGDASLEQVLQNLGLEHASVVVVTFADPPRSLAIVSAVRRLRQDVPVLVRTEDDARLDELQRAGATEVVPETFEASLMLVSHVLLCLNTPMPQVVRVVGEIRGQRYAALRGEFQVEDGAMLEDWEPMREELRTVVLPPGAWGVGRELAALAAEGATVTVTALRRSGIVGRDPARDTVLREGDVLVLLGTAAALEHAESILLAG